MSKIIEVSERLKKTFDMHLEALRLATVAAVEAGEARKAASLATMAGIIGVTSDNIVQHLELLGEAYEAVEGFEPEIQQFLDKVEV